MTQENKELLLNDLCCRLPYGVIVKDRNGIHKLTNGNTEFTDLLYNGKCNIKPYLFPMSSMTKEQKEEYCQLQQRVIYNSKGVVNEDIMEYINWCYKKCLDVNNLIPKGLAIDCTNLNIY